MAVRGTWAGEWVSREFMFSHPFAVGLRMDGARGIDFTIGY